METILVNVNSKKNVRFFLEFAGKCATEQEFCQLLKKKTLVLKIMKLREHEKSLPLETSLHILDSIK